MSNLSNRFSLLRPRSLLDKIKGYSRKAGELGPQVRELVFGFGLRSTVDVDRWSLPVKLSRHRLLQRQRAYQLAGGDRSSMAMYALNKARHQRQQL